MANNPFSWTKLKYKAKDYVKMSQKDQKNISLQ